MADAAEHIDADSQQVQHNLDHAAETQAMPHGGPTEGIEASGGTEHHVDPSALGLNGTAWVSLAMLIFLGILLRSEEHTSELQSLMRISYAVFCLKKKNN